MGKYLYGIDFGTSNSAISIYDNLEKKIIDTITIPSILYFSNLQESQKPLKYFVGEEAVSEYIREGMKGRFMKSIKRVLPRTNFTETRIFNKKMDASDLVSLLLKELKGKADIRIGENCTQAIIGRPVFFDDDDKTKDNVAQTRLLKASELAGFTNVKFQYEPIAAAFAYEKSIHTKEKVLVADLGGGTTDFSFIVLDPQNKHTNDRRKDVIATGGIYVGGDSFDSAFMFKKGTPHFGRGVQYESLPGKFLDLPQSFFTNICSWEKMNFFNGFKMKNELEKYYTSTNKNRLIKNLITLIDRNLGYQVFQAIEKTKIDLSEKIESYFLFSKEDIEIDELVRIEEYDEIIKDELKKIERYLDYFIQVENINPNEIDSLFLTGGTSLVKAIQHLFKTKFPSSKFITGDNFTSVSKGLAYSGYLFDS